MAFFQDSRPAREPFLNAPASVLWLIGALLALHAARAFLPENLANEILINYAFVPARYSGAAASVPAASLFDQAVTAVSYIFLHANFTHVIINTLWLLAFGPAVARRLGAGLFILFFLVCGIAAASVHLALNWESPVPVVGASGSVAGLMAAGIRIMYRERTLQFGERPRIAPILAPPVLFFSAIWVVVNIIAGITGLGLTDNMAIVAWEAHLGGYFTGLFLLGPLDRLRARRIGAAAA
ncbi:MAG: rhomboid family intramembrane serine protease [Alphaproteobacteria bacterium]